MAFPAVARRVEETRGHGRPKWKPGVEPGGSAVCQSGSGCRGDRGSISTHGPAFKALFPNGLDAELYPIGPSQVAAAVTLRERLATQPAAAKVAKPVPTA